MVHHSLSYDFDHDFHQVQEIEEDKNIVIVHVFPIFTFIKCQLAHHCTMDNDKERCK